MWMNGSRSLRSTPANALRTGNPSPSTPLGALVTDRIGRWVAAPTSGMRGSAVTSSTVTAGIGFLLGVSRPITAGPRRAFRRRSAVIRPAARRDPALPQTEERRAARELRRQRAPPFVVHGSQQVSVRRVEPQSPVGPGGSGSVHAIEESVGSSLLVRAVDLEGRGRRASRLPGELDPRAPESVAR